MVSKPTGSLVNKLIIIAIPLTPPTIIEFGYRKNWKPAANSAAPTTISRYWNAIALIFLFLIIIKPSVYK